MQEHNQLDGPSGLEIEYVPTRRRTYSYTVGRSDDNKMRPKYQAPVTTREHTATKFQVIGVFAAVGFTVATFFGAAILPALAVALGVGGLAWFSVEVG